MVLSSDEEVFGGYRNVTKDADAVFSAQSGDYDGRPHSFMVRACQAGQHNDRADGAV